MPTKTPSHRAERVGQEIRRELARLLATGELKHPAAVGAAVTAVLVSGDLQVARVFVRSVGGEPSRAALLAALESAHGWVRKALGARLSLRRVPTLRFEWDDSVDHGRRIEELLAEIGSGSTERS